MLKQKLRTKAEKEELAKKIETFKKQQAQQTPSQPLSKPLPNLPVCIVVDIDGTLAKRGDRGIYDFKKSINDAPFFQLKFLLELIDDANKWINGKTPKVEIIVVTGREDCFRDVTNEWLNKHQFPFTHLYMRRTADHRPSNIVKEDIWAVNIRNKYNVLFVIDDREQDVVMWRSKGLYVLIADNSHE